MFKKIVIFCYICVFGPGSEDATAVSDGFRAAINRVGMNNGAISATNPNGMLRFGADGTVRNTSVGSTSQNTRRVPEAAVANNSTNVGAVATSITDDNSRANNARQTSSIPEDNPDSGSDSDEDSAALQNVNISHENIVQVNEEGFHWIIKDACIVGGCLIVGAGIAVMISPGVVASVAAVNGAKLGFAISGGIMSYMKDGDISKAVFITSLGLALSFPGAGAGMAVRTTNVARTACVKAGVSTKIVCVKAGAWIGTACKAAAAAAVAGFVAKSNTK